MRASIAFTSVLALAMSGAAIGQDGEDADPPSVSNENETGESNDTVRFPPVRVTARKWEEDAQKVPQSVTAVLSDVLENAGIKEISDAQVYVPNLNIVEFSSRRLSFPYIRGIGSGQGDPAVATYIDGVPQLAISSTNIPLLDVERIEFLRGPQATLYGRNALGGLMHVISKRPSLNENSVALQGTVGDYGYYEGNVRANRVLKQDELALSISGLYMEREGYTTNTITGNDVDFRETLFGRAQLLWAIDDQNELRVDIHGERARDGGFTLTELTGLRAMPHRLAYDFEGVTERDILSPSVTWEHAGDTVDMISISTLQTWDIFETSDFDFSAFDGVRRQTEEEQTAFIQEFRISSAEHAPVELSENVTMRWLAGVLAFYNDSERSAINEFRPPGAGFLFPAAGFDASRGDFEDFGIGVFGQATLTINDTLDIGAGLRYDYEDKEANLSRTFDAGFGPFPLLSASQSESYDELLPRVDVAWRCCEDWTVYGLAARGFKAGGFNLSAPTSMLAFGPETSWTYEAGVKTSLADDRLLVNAAIFYIDWEDMQLSQFSATDGGFVTNAGASESMGAEIEVVARPAEGLELFASFGYTDTEFDSYTDIYGLNVAGNELPYAPETTFGVGAQYSAPINDDVEFYVRGEYLDVGMFYYDPGNRLGDSYGIASFRAGIGGANWRVEGWIRNAFDDEFVPVAFQPSPVDPTMFVGESGNPTTMGLTFSLRF